MWSKLQVSALAVGLLGLPVLWWRSERPSSGLAARGHVEDQEPVDLRPGAVVRTTPASDAGSESIAPPPRAATASGCRVEGVVTDERGRPLAHAAVDVLRQANVERLGDAATDEEGRFSLVGLPVGEPLLLRAKLPRYKLGKTELYPQSAGQVLSRTIALQSGQRISGHVVDASGQPLAGAAVGASDLDVNVTRSGAGGEFELLGIGTDPVNVFAQFNGFATSVEHGIAPGATRVKLTLERAATVVGAIAVPPTVDHVLVSACHFDDRAGKELCVARQVVRAPDLQYHLDGLASGPYELLVEAPGYPARRATIRVAAGQQLRGPPLDPTVSMP